MSAHQAIAPPVDEIRVFLPEIGQEEYALRRRLVSARNVAAFALNDMPGEGARDLCIHLRDCAAAWVYFPGSIDQLQDALALCQMLWHAIQLAEKLEGRDG